MKKFELHDMCLVFVKILIKKYCIFPPPYYFIIIFFKKK